MNLTNPDSQRRKERLNFERKQRKKISPKKNIDDGNNWKLGKYIEECR